MEEIHCILCGADSPRYLFSKDSNRGESFRLVQCRRCGLEFVSPRPSHDEISCYYESGYFTTRTERGYNNYFSESIEREVKRVMGLNCKDLGFFEFEKNLPKEKRSLDIGCAAGYFVELLRERGWDSAGIDISEECVAFAKSHNLKVSKGDYLSTSYDNKFHAITLWATIEHLHYPDRILEKANADLLPQGRLFLSTCRTGEFNFKRLFGKEWRYYNFPEHLFFFSKHTIKMILERAGFRVISYATYGSGCGKPGSFIRRTADSMAKRFQWGDMMLVAAEKVC